MKLPSIFLRLILVTTVALLPLGAEAKPKKEEGKKGGQKREQVQRSPQKAKQQSARKAPDRGKRKNEQASKPERSPKISKSKGPKRESTPKMAKQERRAAPSKPQKKFAEAEKRSDVVRPQRKNTDGVQPGRGKEDRIAKIDDRPGRQDKFDDGRGQEGANRPERRGDEGRNRNFADKKDSARDNERRAQRAEVRDRVEKDRKHQIAQRKDRHRDRVNRFRENRKDRFAAVNRNRQALRNARAEARREYREEVREEIRDYWKDRADDVRDRIDDRRDRLFDDDWWEHHHWGGGPVLVSSPWWWWRPAEWSSVNVFIGGGWTEPVVYDYGTDVLYDDSAVYLRGEYVGSPVEYSRQVVELASPAVAPIAQAPLVEEDWQPLGVWALVQEDQGDAVMFFQLSVDRQGIISGAYSNVVSGEELPIVGRVDRATQRAAWHIGDQKEKVFEAGMSNLTQDQASCLVHVSPGEMQTWLLVRMPDPSLPDQPTKLSQARVN
jgi:hypothetical protein